MSIYLVLGISIFCLIHFFPTIFVNVRKAIIDKIGFNPYRGIYSLISISSLFLIYFGWRSSEVIFVFQPTEWSNWLALVLMFPALMLFISSNASSNIKRIIRNPQLSAVALWGIAHCLANGDSRSIVLFLSFTIWAIIEIIMLNRRNDAWQKPTPVAFSKDFILVIITTVVYSVLLYSHGYFTNVSLRF